MKSLVIMLRIIYNCIYIRYNGNIVLFPDIKPGISFYLLENVALSENFRTAMENFIKDVNL